VQSLDGLAPPEGRQTDAGPVIGGASERLTSDRVRRLLREVLGPAANKPDLSTAIFVVIRSFAFSHRLLDSMAYDTLAPKRDRAQRHRRLLAEMLAPYVEMAAKAER
jgi:hypothetical protein